MHQRRKADHLRISLEEDVQFEGLTTGFERYRFIHQALPEMDLKEVDLSFSLFGKRLEAPLIISSMTGGIEPAERINRNLARAAQKMGVAMGVGSLRPAIDDPSLARTYQVPATNNACENAIGRGGKIRAKRMRGFKRADTLLPILFLLASLAGVLAGVPFQSLIT